MSIMVVVEDQGVLNHRFAKKLSSEQIHCPTLRITIVTSIPLPQYVTVEKDKWFERLRDAIIDSFLLICRQSCALKSVAYEMPIHPICYVKSYDYFPKESNIYTCQKS